MILNDLIYHMIEDDIKNFYIKPPVNKILFFRKAEPSYIYYTRNKINEVFTTFSFNEYEKLKSEVKVQGEKGVLKLMEDGLPQNDKFIIEYEEGDKYLIKIATSPRNNNGPVIVFTISKMRAIKK